MIIHNSTTKDIPTIFHLYEQATELQRQLIPSNVWPTFEKEMVQREIMEKKQWKLMVGDQIAGVWATAFSDPLIWEEKNIDEAVYIHRIAANPDFKGMALVKKIVTWATAYAKSQRKKFIRMDTCGNNQKLINYYGEAGFSFLGMRKLKDSNGLPEHYQDADVCFFEIIL